MRNERFEMLFNSSLIILIVWFLATAGIIFGAVFKFKAVLIISAAVFFICLLGTALAAIDVYG